MKKMEILAVCLSLWLSGCVTAPIGYSRSEIYMTSISPIPRIGKNYKIGETYSIDTGSTMVKIFNAHVFPEYKSIYNYQPPGIPFRLSFDPLFEMPEITSAQKWRAAYSYESDYIIFCNDYSPKYGIRIKPNGELLIGRVWINLYDKTFEDIVWNLSDPKLFEPTEGDLIEDFDNSFKAELVYTGKMGNVITISYREFIDNIARPAFYQDLRYDLGEGDNITFKSLKIKVLEATNSKISFQVIDDGGLPWVPVKTGRTIS